MGTPGKIRLYQWHNQNSGMTEELGEYSNLREATLVARAVAKVSKHTGRFGASSSFTEAEKKQHGYDGLSYTISTEPAPYNPHQEITLSDGRVVWLEDVDEALRTILDTPV